MEGGVTAGDIRELGRHREQDKGDSRENEPAAGGAEAAADAGGTFLDRERERERDRETERETERELEGTGR